MFATLLNKFNELAHHHQLFFAGLAWFCFISLTWGIEKLLETYLFPQKPVIGYMIAATGGLVLLWITQHFILHVL